MPQTATFSIGAKVEKGPDIKSEAKFEFGSYAAIIEETVNKFCSSDPPIDLQLPPSGCTEMLVIAADKYAVDGDPTTNGAMTKCEKKYIKYWFETSGGCPTAVDFMKPVTLKGPHVFVGPSICLLPSDGAKLHIQNELPIDVKVSILVMRKRPLKSGETQACAPAGAKCS